MNELTMQGQLLTPAPGSLTPLCPGRIKAPPVCTDPSLKRSASNIDAFNTAGVCFSLKEADNCAAKASVLDGKFIGSSNVEEMPLNIQNCDTRLKSHVKSVATDPLEGNKIQLISSSSTVVTVSSTLSCDQSVMGYDVAAAALVSARKDPPLAVIRTDLAFNSEDENSAGGTTQHQHDVLAAVSNTSQQPTTAPALSSTSLFTTFTDNLAKESSSRQGRSLQRWLIHESTEELVRQVAGTIPITRDGRIILISASRKTEWILPKGGWDNDESKEECAARETFEEGGLLGTLGDCLAPIDYETAKAKKRRLSKGSGEDKGGKSVVDCERKRNEGENEHLCPPLCKRARPDRTLTAPKLSPSTIKKVGLSESPSSSGTSCVNSNKLHLTPARVLFDPKNYSYVRLFLFPLYVSSVKSDWPEKGRLRKLVDIDEAIKIMDAENRLYFKKGLEMLKERGLHLLKP